MWSGSAKLALALALLACSSTSTNPASDAGSGGSSSGGSPVDGTKGGSTGTGGSGASGGAGGGSGGCIPLSCAQLLVQCGATSDGCGNTLDCNCPQGQRCDKDFEPGQCWGVVGTWNVVYDKCTGVDFAQCNVTSTWMFDAQEKVAWTQSDGDCSIVFDGKWSEPVPGSIDISLTQSCPSGACALGCSGSLCAAGTNIHLTGKSELPKWTELLLSIDTSGPPCSGDPRTIDMLRQ